MTLHVGVRVCFADIMPIRRNRFVRRKLFKPYVKVVMKTAFVIVYKDACGNVHGICQNQAFTYSQLDKKALDVINRAITFKDNIRANLGTLQNRLKNTITNLQIQAENMQAAESRISDVDVATEMTNFVRN